MNNFVDLICQINEKWIWRKDDNDFGTFKVLSQETDLLEKVKGIGPKTAKRIVLELKDKMLKVTDASNLAWAAPGGVGSHKQEALSALVALGFAKQQSENAINKVLTKAPDLDSVEAIIKAALQAL
jgi:Holliday junction DNA helicase RuvA